MTDSGQLIITADKITEFFCNADEFRKIMHPDVRKNFFLQEGLGYAIGFDKIINTSDSSNLCFRPLEPRITASMYIIWKKYQVLTKAAELFLQRLRKNIYDKDSV